MSVYRLFIDEVGTDDMTKSIADPRYQHLSLTGVACNLDYAEKVIRPQLEQIKVKYFGVGFKESLHRREILRKQKSFSCLVDPEVDKAFHRDLFSCLNRWEYTVFTVTLDKFEHKNRYKVWSYYPYHYCLHIILERYVMWLTSRSGTGDVMAEARNASVDRKLSNSHLRVYAQGTVPMEAKDFQERLTSRNLKLKTKTENIAGLQLADLLAHSCFRGAMARRYKQPFPSDYDRRVVELLEASKLDSDGYGRLDGYGYKWLP